MKDIWYLLMTSTAIGVVMPAWAQAQDAGAQGSPAPAGATAPASPQATVDKAVADSGFGEIVVTARQRAENLQRVPDSITALGTELIEQKNIKGIKDLSVSIPNMGYSTDLSPASLFINMRGINTFRGSEPGVSVIIDNVQVASAESLSQALNDVQQIEVLKGPQAALYGRNAIAGAINITTKKPTNEFVNRVELGYGNGEDFSMSANSSGALVKDKLFFRIQGDYRKFDGIINNDFLDKKADFLTSKSVRGRLIWEPTSNFTIDARVNYDHLNSGAYYYNTAVDGNLVAIRDAARNSNLPILSPVLTAARRSLLQSDVVAEYKRDSGAIIRYVFSYQRLHEEYGLPGTGAAGNIGLPGNLGMAPIQTIGNGQTYLANSYTNELRYISPSNKPFRYTFGIYNLKTKRRDTLPVFVAPNNYAQLLTNAASGLPITTGLDPNEPIMELPGTTNTRGNNNSLGIYAQVNYDLTPELELTAAYRYDRDRREQTDLNSGGVAKKTFQAHEPKVSIAWKPGLELMFYGSISRGARSGGFNKIQDPNDPGSFQLLFAPETLWNYEVGFKTSLFDRKLIFNGAAFYEDIKDHQEFAFLPNVAAQIVYNIPKSRIFGLELDTVYHFDRQTQVGLSVGYLDTKITKFDGTDAGFATDIPGVGRPLPGVYQWQYTTFAQHSADVGRGKLVGRVEWSQKGNLHWFHDGLNKGLTVGLLGGSLSYQQDAWKLTLWGENLNNKRYYASYQPSSQTGLAVDIAYRALGRRLGAKLGVTF